MNKAAKDKPFLSIVIPAYNEEKRLPKTLKSIFEFLKRQDYSSEVIVVDDGSSDATASEVKNEKLKVKNLRLLTHPKNLGKGAAVRTGVLTARGEFILFTDADGSTPIGEVNKLLPHPLDIAIGSRYLPQSHIKIRQPWYRRFLGLWANKLIQLTLLPGISDTQCGFKLFRANAAKEIFASSTINRWGFDMEILFLAQKRGYRIKEVPIIWVNSPQTRLRPVRSALSTLGELIQIKWNQWQGKY